MAENTHIEWADHTFNPWEGCQKVGPGCDNCYAEDRNRRFAPKGSTAAPNWGPHAPRRRTSPANWRKPHIWQRNAAAFLADNGRRQRVFCASLADVFDGDAPDEWRIDLAKLIRATPDLDWLLLTKRIGCAAKMLVAMFGKYTPPNVRLGITVVNQKEADRDIPWLHATKIIRDIGSVFLSIEPMLGPITLRRNTFPAWLAEIDQVIVGGESGRNARPMHPDWARGLRDECAAVGVPFLFKQWGEWVSIYDRDRDDPHWNNVPKAGDWDRRRFLNLAGGQGFHGDSLNLMKRVGKKTAGRLLDGVEHNGFPA